MSQESFLTMLSRDLIVSQGISVTMLVQHFCESIPNLTLRINIEHLYVHEGSNPHLLAVAIKVKDISDHSAQPIIREPL